MLVDEGTTIVKCSSTCRRRSSGRGCRTASTSPDERWKFRRGDLDDRKLWPDYMQAYQERWPRRRRDDAPWYVVPGDRKWVRNLAVAQILRDALERIDPKYPEPEEGIEGLVVE